MKIYFKVLLGLFLTLCMFLLWILLKLVIIQDVSLKPVIETVKHHEGVYLISYADGDEVFLRNQNALTVSAINKGIDGIVNYQRHHIDDAFYQAHKDILDKKRGAGYWLWKPYFIQKSLKQLPENAIIIYADAGSVICQPVDKLINLAKEHAIVLIEDMQAENKSNKVTTKRAIFKALHCDDGRCHNSRHIWAGFIVLRNTPEARFFIDTWLSWCIHKDLINDHTESDEYPEFRYTQHDQSILTAVCALNADKIYVIKIDDLLRKIIIWHHRHATGENKRSLIPNIYPVPGIIRKIWLNISYLISSIS